METDSLNARVWAIAYITPIASLLGPGPWFWQCVTSPDEGHTRVIERFERESYAQDVEYFTVTEIKPSGLSIIGNFKFTNSVRHYERMD